MRALHAEDEDDSRIVEGLLRSIRDVFGRAAVLIAHHVRKRGGNPKSIPRLVQDMRRWSDEARGSGALKAHADMIVCQERCEDLDGEVVYLGAFGKDWADLPPMRLKESGHETFHWVLSDALPDHLRLSLQHLKAAGGTFPDKQHAKNALMDHGICESSLGARGQRGPFDLD